MDPEDMFSSRFLVGVAYALLGLAAAYALAAVRAAKAPEAPSDVIVGEVVPA